MNGTIRRPLTIALAALFAALTLAAGRASAAPQTSDAVVKATVAADKPGPDGRQTATLTLAIDRGWHLYANPVGQADLAPVQTDVGVKAKGALAKMSRSTTPRARRSTTRMRSARQYRVHYFTYEEKATIPIHR